MSLQLFIPSSIVMGKHWQHHHQSSDQPPQTKKASPAQASRPTSTTSSLLKALSRGRESSTPQPTITPSPARAPASENHPTPTPISTPTPTAANNTLVQPPAHDQTPKPAPRPRVPAVTSKAMTTAPLKDKSRPPRRKYPSNMRQR